ncbi:MAG TPA: penicillin-binding transpeptidase domain-containing protein [Longimicrobiaceae bacterium]|nr:penicillin-binding transpeptidase domain-containing protein [Longimicrobiaceae bacterium]
MLDTVLNWVLRAALLAFGAGALIALLRWMGQAIRERRERWAIRLAIGMLIFAAIYAFGHARMLMQAEELEEGRMAWRRFGDPRESERNRGEVRGWIMDCTNEPANALARYGVRDGEVQRVYPLGEGGANLIGAGGDDDRDYTVERVFARHLRKPLNFAEQGELHPVGTDLQLTLCTAPTRRAWSLLQQTGLNGAIIVQDVNTGALVAYASTGGADEPPFGIKRYAPPGSVFKLALASLWYESNLPDDAPIPCPPSIQVTPRATISNFGGIGYGTVIGPEGMLIPSCNTAAVRMALDMRERLGTEAFERAYRSYGFIPYGETPPPAGERDFWSTTSTAWERRMSPPPSRIRLSEQTGPAEWAQLSIGQGPVDVTVIGVSRFVQAIGNGGVMLRPTLEWERTERPQEVGRVMRPETAQKLQQAMLAVVERGTARSVAPRVRGTGWQLGGKTGTAQVAGAPDDGWFAGLMFGPEGEPRYSVVVYLQRGGPGGGQPAAIAAEMLRFLARDEAQPQVAGGVE